MTIRNRVIDHPGPLVPQATGPRGPAGDDGKSAYQSYLDTTDDDPVLSEEAWAAAFSTSTNNTTIGPVPPENPQPGDTWIDTEGWIESYWHAQEDAGEAGGYWISTQPRPSNVGFLVYGTYSLIWTPVEAGTEYNLIWTPTT
jgi:hypothetical protein